MPETIFAMNLDSMWLCRGDALANAKNSKLIICSANRPDWKFVCAHPLETLAIVLVLFSIYLTFQLNDLILASSMLCINQFNAHLIYSRQPFCKILAALSSLFQILVDDTISNSFRVGNCFLNFTSICSYKINVMKNRNVCMVWLHRSVTCNSLKLSVSST